MARRKKKSKLPRTVTFRRKSAKRKRSNPKGKAALKRAQRLMSTGKAKTWSAALKKAWHTRS